jgi:hypothetical protein
VGSAVTNASGCGLAECVSLAGINAATYATGVAANFAGDASFAAAVARRNLTVSKANTTTTVSSSVSPSVFGQSVTLHRDGQSCRSGSRYSYRHHHLQRWCYGPRHRCCECCRSSHLLDFQLVVNAHSITAEYGGDTNFNGSTSSALSQTVSKASTSTSVSSSLNPSIYGQSITFTATVSVIAPVPELQPVPSSSLMVPLRSVPGFWLEPPLP